MFLNFLISRLYNKNISIKISTIIIILLFYVSYIPTTIYDSYNSNTWIYFSLYNCYWLLIFYFNKMLEKFRVKFPKIIINNIKKEFFKKTIRKIIQLTALLFVLYTSYKVYGKVYVHFGLADVYNLRSNETLSNFGTLYSLILVWIGNLIIPVMAVYQYKAKNYFSFFYLVIAQIISFSIAGHKTQLFLIPVGIFTSYFLNKKNIKYLPFAFFSFSLVSILELVIKNTDFLLEYFVRRVFYVPALLNFYYFDYFSTNSKLLLFEDMFFSRVFIKILGLTPNYSIPASKIIGANYFGRPEMLSNNGMFSYAYADMGFIGIIFGALMLVVILHIINWSMSKIDISYSGIVVVIFTMAFLSVSISSVIYSYLIPLIFLRFLFKNELSKYSNSERIKEDYRC